MKHSIQVKISALVVIFMSAIFMVSWMIYNIKGKELMISEAKTGIYHTYLRINQLCDENSIDTKALHDEFLRISSQSNQMILILEPDGTFYTTMYERSSMQESLINMLTVLSNSDSLGTDVSYVIQTNHDSKINSDYIDLIGYLANGDMIAIRTSVESINTYFVIANKLFLYITIIMLLIACLVIYIITRQFTRPIHKMSIIAKRMSELDFDAKIHYTAEDEVGELGHSMNILSTKLQQTISELKTANNELKKDIAQKSQIDDMRKEFLSHVSHELKTPIALIQGYAEGLKEGINEDPESTEFYCDVIMDEANKMNTMVKKLLSLNEIEFGQTPVNIERFNLSELIENIVKSYEMLLDDKQVSIVIPSGEPIYAWADEFLIEEVLSNYITNAIHYVSDPGKIEISIVQEESEYKVTVFNTGTKIPDEELDKLWIKFYKVDKARTREYGGSGIGLSIVAATMKAHGKQYGVYNCEDGVAFYFYLDGNNS